MTDAQNDAQHDRDLLAHIDELVAEEKKLRAEHHGLTGEDRQRLETIERQLDQLWDLLRQRRAREEFGENPDDAKERPANEVEGYLQ
jgi:hypothetical protein